MQKYFLMALLGYEACQEFPISRGNFGFNNVNIDIPLRAASTEGDYVDPESPLGRNLARTCVRSFLTQRSVQSFMFLLSHCRDPRIIKWIENYGEVRNFPGFHGTGAFNTTRFPVWDSFLMDMMDMTADEVIVRIGREAGERRGKFNNRKGNDKKAKVNPFLEVSWEGTSNIFILCGTLSVLFFVPFSYECCENLYIFRPCILCVLDEKFEDKKYS